MIPSLPRSGDTAQLMLSSSFYRVEDKDENWGHRSISVGRGLSSADFMEVLFLAGN